MQPETHRQDAAGVVLRRLFGALFMKFWSMSKIDQKITSCRRIVVRSLPAIGNNHR